jgi:UDP-N-acetylmuramyl pentapeptide phosphotransferase/UDP-N-acetylglucosamine-1-phosphate transferase
MTGFLVWLGGWAFGLSLVLTPIVRDIFSSDGLMDPPDGARKMHRKPIPRVGGIAVAISYFGSFWLVARYPGGLDSRQVSLVWTLLPSALVISPSDSSTISSA